MKLKMSSTNGLIVALIAVAVLVAGFWMLALSPKRDEAKKLGVEVEKVEGELAEHREEVNMAEEARAGFPVDYQQLVSLGKAVPGDDDTSSLLVQLHRISERSKVRFETFTLGAGEGEAPAPAPEAPSTEEETAPASPTEAAASLLPLGATIGTAGLGVMPYTLKFEGSFFHMADFVKGLDSMVKTRNEQVTVDGRLITIDGFNLKEAAAGFPRLEASVDITTYVTPPEVGLTGGATPSGPAPATATPASTTIGGTG
jgi:Tfp pilus assembly protein PilO